MLISSVRADVILDASNSVLSASLVKYDPTPAEPGQYLTAWVKLSNLGNTASPNAVIEFEPTFPFSMDGSDTLVKSFRIGSQQDYVFEYKIRVDPKAVTGTNSLKFRFSNDPTLPLSSWSESTFDISVRSSVATITVSDVNVQGGALSPGIPSTVTLTLQNTAGIDLKNIQASLNLFTSQTATATSVATSDVPISPVGTTTNAYVTHLATNDSANVTFDLAAYPDALDKLYKIPLALTFEDEAGNSYTKTDLIGIYVSSKPDVTAIIDSTDLTQSNRIGKVSIKIINKGLSGLKFVTVQLKSSSDFQLLSQSDTVYIGKLDSDDFQTVDFSIKATGGKTSVSVPVDVTYLDSLNNPYQKTYPLQVQLLDGSDVTGGSSAWPIIIIVVIVIVGVFIFLRMRRKRTKK